MLYALLSVAFLLIGFTIGWLASERYQALIDFEPHGFEELFERNPHPEIFQEDGTVYRGDYAVVNFDLGYDPEEFKPEDIFED